MIDYSKTNEGELIQLAQSGDRDALNELVVRYRKRIIGWLRFRVRDDDLVHDVAQNASARFSRSISSFDPTKASLKTWSDRIAKNELLRILNARRTHTQTFSLSPEFTESQLLALIPQIQQALTDGNRVCLVVETAAEKREDMYRAEDLINECIAELDYWSEIEIPFSPRNGIGYFAQVASARAKRLPTLSLDRLMVEHDGELAAGNDEILERIDQSNEERIAEPNRSQPRISTLLSRLITEARILRVTCEHSSPWQMLAFCFNKMFLWKPARIIADLAENSLLHIEQMAEEQFVRSPHYSLQRLVEPAMQKIQPTESKHSVAEQLEATTFGISSHEFVNDFEPLRKKMPLKVAAALAKNDGTSKDLLSAIMENVVGETQLKNYFGKRPADSITNLSNKVRNRVIEESVKFLKSNPQPLAAHTMA